MYDSTNPLCVENDRAESWYLDKEGNAYFFPQGWASELEDKNEERAELYGYYPINIGRNSPVDTGYVGCDFVAGLTRTTEAEARQSHPAMAEYLDAINAGV